MPGSGSADFDQPDSTQMAGFRSIVDSILVGNVPAADTLASRLDYVLFEWSDSGTGRDYYVLMEPNAEQPGGVVHGWGTFIVEPLAPLVLALEVPHPRHDLSTWELGRHLLLKKLLSLLGESWVPL